MAVLLVTGLALCSAAYAAAPEPDDARPLPTIGGVSGESRVEPRFSAVATNLARRTVEVRCWSVTDWRRLDAEWRAYVGTGLEGWNGYVSKHARHRLHLHPSVCARLVALTYKGYRPRTRAGRVALASALLTIAHEAQHSAGISSEVVAECNGLQRIRPVARMLGATKDFAAVLARVAWLYVYPRQPAEQRSANCRNGGTLDINKRTAIWP